jgi:hypothetical protein
VARLADDGERDAILMREVRGLSYEEVASELLITPTAVRSLLFRARQSLQVRLREVLASFSPGFALRDLLARAGGRVGAPAAAKALAVGVGAAVITGGALVGPSVIRFGHAPSTHRATNSAHGGTQPRASVTSERPSRLFAASRGEARSTGFGLSAGILAAGPVPNTLLLLGVNRDGRRRLVVTRERSRAGRGGAWASVPG